jgi:tripartite-type tricarboxylate transporter receptor subunit TctC
MHQPRTSIQTVCLSKIAAILALLALAIQFSAPAQAQDEAAYFKEKTIRLIVPFGPGGGFDTYARMLAPHIGNRLGAKVVVENQPGAGGVSALNKFVSSQPDGLQIMLIQGNGVGSAQLAGQSSVRFDLAELGYLATVAASPWMWLVEPKSNIRTLQDALAKTGRIRWGASGPMDGQADGATFTCEVLKLKCQVILGYKGSRDVSLALARSELDAMYVSDTSAANYVKSGGARPVMAVGRKRSHFFPQIPTIFEAAKLTGEAEWLIDFHSSLEDLGRILVAPPKLPPARLTFLQEAVKAVLTDKDVIAEGKKRNRFIDFEDAATTRKRVLSVIRDLTPAQRKRVVELLQRSS